MRNLTLTLDDETARWARLEAARKEVSVSRFVRDLLRLRMQDEVTYERAMSSYLSRPLRTLQRHGPYPSREELHDRAGLR